MLRVSRGMTLSRIHYHVFTNSSVYYQQDNLHNLLEWQERAFSHALIVSKIAGNASLVCHSFHYNLICEGIILRLAWEVTVSTRDLHVQEHSRQGCNLNALENRGEAKGCFPPRPLTIIHYGGVNRCCWQSASRLKPPVRDLKDLEMSKLTPPNFFLESLGHGLSIKP